MYKHIEKDEKKLTDEEIVKALEICSKWSKAEDCDKCPLSPIKQCRANNVEEYAVDLIHRLQAEKQKVVQDYYCARQTCDEQKAEIERLTEKDKKNVDIIHTAMNDHIKLQKQVDELTDKLKKILLGVKADEMLVAKGVEQAVKDTAKKYAKAICKELWNRGKTPDGKMFDYGDLTSIDVWRIAKEQFGVEVE